MSLSRRSLLGVSTAALAVAAFGLPARAATDPAQQLIIAYNLNLPSWDPTVGSSAVNPTIQGIYQSGSTCSSCRSRI